jgi:hypothetical protein
LVLSHTAHPVIQMNLQQQQQQQDRSCQHVHAISTYKHRAL